MKNTIPKNGHKGIDATLAPPFASPRGVSHTDGADHHSALRKTRRRYCTMTLVVAIFVGAALMLLGYPALAKGLVLGALFSALNFFLMALALPTRLGKGRGKSLLYSMGSIYLRYAILALPLVWAFNKDAFAFSTAAVGLFMVQFVILGDHLLSRWRHPMEGE